MDSAGDRARVSYCGGSGGRRGGGRLFGRPGCRSASGLQCAELQAKLGPLELARRARRAGKEYGTAWLVVERNNHGSGVLAYLKSVFTILAFTSRMRRKAGLPPRCRVRR